MSLRRIVKSACGQDVFMCQACNDCDMDSRDDIDIPLSGLVQLILLDDEEALDCRTLWSEPALEAARTACKRGLDLRAVMIALREEADRRTRAVKN
jgi:hypothetical protein